MTTNDRNPFMVSFTLRDSSRAALSLFAEGMVSAAEAMERFGAWLIRATAAVASLPPAPHAFTPDYDLCCTVRGCGLGPEEH